MDQLSAMRAFLRVVETGNFTRASASLNVPKATISNLIQGWKPISVQNSSIVRPAVFS